MRRVTPGDIMVLAAVGVILLVATFWTLYITSGSL